MDLPVNVETGMVVGRYIVDVIDGVDENRDPDAQPVQGQIVFTSSVPYLPNPTAAPDPVTILRVPIVGVLDQDGYLCTPYPGTLEPQYRGVRLIATDDPDIAVTDWTWDVTYIFEPINGHKLAIPAHGFSLPSGGTVDLTKVAKVPSSPGYSLPQAEAAVLRAEEAALAGAADSLAARQAADRAEQAAAATDEGITSMLSDPDTQSGGLLADRLASKANADDVELSLSGKADKQSVDAALEDKAGKAETSASLQSKADLISGKVPVGQLPTDALVTDANVAAQVNGTQTGPAIDARINTQVTPLVQPVVADYIASQPAVVDAAAAAVDANPKIATAVFNGDARLLERVEAEKPVAFAVVDRHGWVHFDSDDVKPTPTYASAEWVHWGDSLTYTDYSGIPGGWVNQLAALTGKNHFNGGWSGQTTDQIAARQGGLPAMVTVAGNMIPASGSVSVTVANPKPVRQAGSRFVMGTLAGVPGKFQEVTLNVVTFTRTTAGVATTCPPGTLFLPDDAPLYADRTVTIWTGRNDVYTATPEAIVERIRTMIQYFTPRVKRIMVLEIPPSETSTATHSLLLAMNNAIKAAFPDYWVPVATYLRTEAAATAAGITFTTDDQADIAAGITPRSFRVDTMHFNATACTAIAKYVYAEAQRRIWL